jgi:hypothetical protein
MTEKIKIHPMVAAPAFSTPQGFTVKDPVFFKIGYWNSKMKRL